MLGKVWSGFVSVTFRISTFPVTLSIRLSVLFLTELILIWATMILWSYLNCCCTYILQCFRKRNLYIQLYINSFICIFLDVATQGKISINDVPYCFCKVVLKSLSSTYFLRCNLDLEMTQDVLSARRAI